MARYIEIYSSGTGLLGGNQIINSENIIHVESDANDTVKIWLSGGGTGADLATVTVAPSAVASSTGVRDAINYALTANPGGVKAKVKLPSGVTVTEIAVS